MFSKCSSKGEVSSVNGNSTKTLHKANSIHFLARVLHLVPSVSKVNKLAYMVFLRDWHHKESNQKCFLDRNTYSTSQKRIEALNILTISVVDLKINSILQNQFICKYYEHGKFTFYSTILDLKKITSPDLIKPLIKQAEQWEEVYKFHSHISSVLGQNNPSVATLVDLDKYLSENLLNLQLEALKWWSDKKLLYPRLYEMVKR
ncbi:zinc finger BED domain-containing protein 1-like [Aphis craccivora]|uniref:Zinc finger BED domain-containing protein 1-like n=1 Tax=Aphis craccivora TaxID=307492 RepID=A0A6G0YWK7_APHCR|nr:zinc finger BED domain-containing protein 1-like [Aphis craccivora]